MMKRTENRQITMHLITIEDLVPQNHLLRKVDALIDFSFIYEELEDSYCKNNGRPSIDPVILIKYLLIGFLYGINSERRIEQEIQVNMAYRWFLKLDMFDKVPDHSTISQNRRRRFQGKEIFRKLFQRLVLQCMEQGLVDGKLIFTDSTHIKANTSRKSEYIQTIEVLSNEYLEELDVYENEERKKLEEEGKIKPQKIHKRQEKRKIITQRKSKTDEEAGFYKRKGKPQGMHYLSHQTIDAKAGIIIDVVATAGNVPDAKPYMKRIDYIEQELGLKIETACADSGYDINLIHQQLYERNIDFVTPKRKEQKRGTAEFQRKDFIYQEETDSFLCPNQKILRLYRLHRTATTISREYHCEKESCHHCVLKERCVGETFPIKRIKVNILEKVVKQHHEKDGNCEHTQILNLRQIWSEGSFAAQKARHNLKYLYRRGLEAAEEQCLLSATALNLKRMIKAMG